jgi:hypothetical protein
MFHLQIHALARRNIRGRYEFALCPLSPIHRAFPPKAVFGPAFTPGSADDGFHFHRALAPMSAVFTRLLAGPAARSPVNQADK